MKTWGDKTLRRLEAFCKSCRCTPAERAELLARWRAQYLVEREAYLATLPELSRMGRQIWEHSGKPDAWGVFHSMSLYERLHE
jgi:hypothetical protein